MWDGGVAEEPSKTASRDFANHMLPLETSLLGVSSSCYAALRIAVAAFTSRWGLVYSELSVGTTQDAQPG